MVRVVNSLFADYLEPTGIADPSQTLLTGEQTTTTEPVTAPVIQPLTDPTPTYEQQPLTKTLQEGFTKEPLVAQTSTPTMIVDPIDYVDPAATAFDPSTIDLDALANLDLSGLDLEALNNLTYQDVTSSLTGVSPAPTSAEGWANLYGQYAQTLGAGMSPNIDIDDRTYAYNYALATQGGMDYQGTPEELRAAVGLPDTFSVYDNPQAGITTESAQGAYQALTSTADPMEALSQYYGIELQAATPNEQSVYTNADKYGTTAENMAEFQSVITPVLQQVIPYIQMTQGLRYDDALEYAYKNDPMVAAIYNKYGVDLFRQTDDGSTYFYDPFSGLEARTVEVKDTSFRDVGLALTLAAVGAMLGPVIGGPVTEALALEGATATAVNAAITNGLTTALQGGDFKDILTSAVTAGVTGPLNQYVGGALGVSDEIAAGIVEAGLQKAQGADTEEALLSGFIAAGSEWLRGRLPADVETNPETGLPYGAPAPSGPVDTGTFDSTSLDAANAALTQAMSENPTGTLEEIVVTAQRINPNLTADILTTVASQVPSITEQVEGGGMLTAETPAGAVEEVVVTPSNDVLYTVPTAEGVIIQTAEGLLPNAEGERWFKIIQEQDPAFYEEMVSAIEQYGTDLGFKWKGIPLNVSDWFGGTTTSQAPEIVVEPTQGDTAVEQITPEDAIQPEQPPLPPADETLDIPEVDIENLPPEVDVTPVVTPPTSPETPQVTTPVTGGGGGAPAGGGAAGGVGVPQVPTIPTDAGGAQGSQGSQGGVPTQGGGEEVVDLFGDAGLTGDAFGDTVTGGADGGAAAEGGDAGTVDVTTTEQYQNLQAELDNALASQSTLEIEVDNLQNEVDAANAALAEAEAAAEAAAAAGASNADELRGEVAAAQATADNLQGQLNSANEALGNANSTIESLQGTLAGTQNELNTALSNIETLTGELNAANAAATAAQAAAEAAVAAGEANATELTEQANAAQEAADALAGQLADANNEIANLQGLLTTSEQQNTALTGQLTEATNNADSLSNQLSTAQGELASLQSEYEAAQEANADTVDELAKEISDKEGEISDLESELSGANATIGDLEAALAESQAATETAIAEGVAAAEAAGEAGYETGYGEGEGVGRGLGAGIGLGLGMLAGQRSGGGGMFTPPQATTFMQQLPTDLTKVQLTPPTNARDYLAELIARLQA
jgi:predicted  nucleic acid-binding Zn-ribbon protein